MRFTDKDLLPRQYRRAFLDWIEKIAPEVMIDLKALTPKYKAVFGKDSNPDNAAQLNWLFTGVDAGEAYSRIEDGVLILAELTGYARYYGDLDPNDLTEHEQKMLENVFDLRASYADFIERYHLKTDWLKRDLFNLLYNLLNRPGTFNPLVFAAFHAEMIEAVSPLHVYIRGWKVEWDSKEFEQSASRTFQTQLKEYIKNRAVFFQSLGYKRYKTRNFERVKWLVWWTVQKIDKSEIIRRIEAELSAKNGKEKYIDSNTIDKAFAEFRSYDLPVR